ncbi:MAG: helix-turn-helix domain-containing protein [Mycobacterium sp.]|uniref:helix-turn-helix domain-containing protein n=1 Tax=Mycobacterium sp. TaxID=1785 RepID=UPI003F98EE62
MRYSKLQRAQRDERIRVLHRRGLSYREVADRVGCSHMAVKRALSRPVPEPDDEDLDDDRVPAADEDVNGFAPPFAFAGLEPPGGGRGAERYVDANGVECSALDIYRADYADGSVGHGYLADAQRQIEAAGFTRVSTGTGFWHWERKR